MRKHIINFVIFGFILLPLLLWLLWIIKPSHKTNILVMDKTVLTDFGLEHRTFEWMLTHGKYFKLNGDFYSPQRDYLGFFPLGNDRFKINDLSKLTERQLDSLSTCTDMTYFTDTYGIYSNEWYRKKDLAEHSEKVYGGLDKNDVLYLKQMKQKKADDLNVSC